MLSMATGCHLASKTGDQTVLSYTTRNILILTHRPAGPLVDQQANQLTDPPKDRPTDLPTDQQTYWQTNRPTNRSTDRPTHRPTDRSTEIFWGPGPNLPIYQGFWRWTLIFQGPGPQSTLEFRYILGDMNLPTQLKRRWNILRYLEIFNRKWICCPGWRYIEKF